MKINVVMGGGMSSKAETWARQFIIYFVCGLTSHHSTFRRVEENTWRMIIELSFLWHNLYSKTSQDSIPPFTFLYHFCKQYIYNLQSFQIYKSWSQFQLVLISGFRFLNYLIYNSLSIIHDSVDLDSIYAEAIAMQHRY